MERKIFRLTESDLRNMIRESISTVMDERFEITKDRLTRFGFNYIKTLCESKGKKNHSY